MHPQTPPIHSEPSFDDAASARDADRSPSAGGAPADADAPSQRRVQRLTPAVRRVLDWHRRRPTSN